MLFASKRQWRKFGAMLHSGEISKAKFDEYSHSSPKYAKLPETAEKAKRARRAKHIRRIARRGKRRK